MARDIHSAEATSSRGSVRIDGRGDLAYPVGEPSGNGTADALNPERLYAAALATCLHQALTTATTAATSCAPRSASTCPARRPTTSTTR
ncbi:MULTISPECIES: hypothetical protein [unclassified Amycolatopsis]|uniref:hypothetical protein n=1 Tax=unclassified Amycolatopsis TaxID=2618356 RepID=UPI00287BAE35|nr:MULTISPECIES: hypothetical protein [unclassified Amycolatopsis]